MFSSGHVNQACFKRSMRLSGGKAAALALALTVSAFATSGAQAQNCVIQPPGNAAPGVPNPNTASIASSPASIGAMIGTSITTASTAFLLQSTAFVGAPGNPEQFQQGGGVWSREVGGGVDLKTNSSTIGTTTSTVLPLPASSVRVPCTQTVHQDFAGVQIGSDISKLNINGWNVHWGTTVGYLGASAHLLQGAFGFTDNMGGLTLNSGGGAFNSSTQVPFVGTYAAATKDGFFIDGLVRAEYYQTTLDAAQSNIFNQTIGARGWSVSGSMGYQYQFPNTKWFIEPSAGFVISRIKVDPFNYVTAGFPGISAFSGTLQLDDIKSDIGRLGLRFGTTITTGNVTVQPFVAVSVWHEFGPNLTSNYATCGATTGGPGCAFFLGVFPATISAASSTSTFGTYGQYSLGFSAVVANTGWLGFARIDYRNGEYLQGLSGTAGLRYQFTPEKQRRLTKDSVPVVAAVNWTGFYVGAFGSGLLGTADWNYLGGGVSPHVGGYSFGGDIGYNYQVGPYVLGIEADLGKARVTGGTACGPLLAGIVTPAAPMFQMTCNAWADWMATATARVGYAWERVLVYAKAGGAWTNQQVSATCNEGVIGLVGSFPVQSCSNPAGVLSAGFGSSKTISGWTVGYGTEFALTRNWSARAEYNYISFGDRNVVASDGSLLNIGMHVWETKVGFNYRFDSGMLYR
jgi:opacity protein-like surface antigen